METSADEPFKVCGLCRKIWVTWEEFVSDAGVRLLGLQALLEAPDASLLVFEHSCGTSVSVLTGRLLHLLPLPTAEQAQWPSLRGTADCRRHCFSLEDHAPCDGHCRNARDRELVTLVETLQAGRAHTRS